MVSFILPDVRRFILDAMDVIYGDAQDAKELMASDLGVSVDTVRHWIHGRRSPPRGAIAALQELLDAKLARAASFKRRLQKGLPLMVCPICGSDFVVHHHAGSRTVKCTANADHIFEPENAPPFGRDVPKRFVLVPAGTGA